MSTRCERGRPTTEVIKGRQSLWATGQLAVTWVLHEPVSREDAAGALDMSRELAAFHLDRLVEAGLLEPEYRRRTGRSGPGAGRPATLYRRVSCEVAVSLPPRRYDLAADLMATALDRLADGSGAEVAADVARERGSAAVRVHGGRPEPARPAAGCRRDSSTCCAAPATNPRSTLRAAQCASVTVPSMPLLHSIGH